MKTRFSTIDLTASVAELQSILHMRIVNAYDIDHKTYLFKLAKPEQKCVLLVESGSRIHKTEYEWPKNPAPSGFTMKLRKHIHNRRLEEIRQLGIDRIVDLTFGCNEAAYHVIIELYDRGNIILTDHEYTILNVLRPRTEGEDVRFAVHEKYPVERAKERQPIMPIEKLREILLHAKEGDNLRKVLSPHLEYGPALIDHVLLSAQFPEGVKIGKGFDLNQDIPRLLDAFQKAEEMLTLSTQGKCKGYITQKIEKRPAKEVENSYLVYNEFHPFLYLQHEKNPFVEFISFNDAIDEFFSKLESQKLDMKAIQQEKEAFKKLENVRKDHEIRIGSLQRNQEDDKQKAELIEINLNLVEKAILTVQSAIANQIDWKEISQLIQEGAQQGDPIAKSIKALKLEINNMTMLLSNPIDSDSEDEDKDKQDGDDDVKDAQKRNISKTKPQLVDIDLDLTAYANAKKFYDKKKFALKKEQKTLESSTKAYKNAEKKMKQTLKEVATVTSINKARKTHWFEKFIWFISSENYLVIGGRDQQQNEIVVKRYLRTGDVYVHADLHGASSIVIKNPSGKEIPPKTLNEAGTMAVCSSAAWDSKVVTSAWWVHPDQVSKTAPTGEYLTTGSFMIRGKKNYLPPCYLVMGFGFLFRLDEESIPNHKDERKVKTMNDLSTDTTSSQIDDEEDVEIAVEDSDDEVGKKETDDLNNRPEEIEEKTEEESLFPDTVIDLEHIEGDRFVAKPRLNSTLSSNASENVIYLGDSQPVVIKPSSNKKGKNLNIKEMEQSNVKKNENEVEEDKKKALKPNGQSGSQLKRGQKYKLKKIKEKYKDEDEEDRALFMALLQGSNEKKKDKKSKDNTNKGKKIVPKTKGQPRQTSEKGIEKLTSTKANEEEGLSDDENEAKQQAEENAHLMDSLTGIPSLDDVILYAVPVCAPYNAIVNYKFKVKLTPGSGKRGKAAKTALAMFLHDKAATPREKDLFRSVKDQDISRNLPGKVKLSAPQLLKQKQR